MTATAAAVVPAPVLSVTVTRAEGFEDELKTVAFVGPGALAEARAELLLWARTAPPKGAGYDKCDFEIRWANGHTYSGRYDLQLKSDGSLAAQVRDHLAWWLEEALRQRRLERVAEIRAFLLGCDLQDGSVVANDVG